MKIYWLIKLATLHYTCARVSLNILQTIQTTPVLGTENIFVNPEGPLNLLRTYLYQEHSFMHNKRLFSPEIRTSYKLQDVNKESYWFNLKYTRTAKDDRPYSFSVEDKSKNSAICVKNIESTECTKDNKHSNCIERDESTGPSKYTSEYHKTLIRMFPSSAGELAIDVNRDDSFTGFLKEASVKKYEQYILAALLLLSEGVDVPLAWEKGEETGAKFLTLRKRYPVTAKQRKFKKKKTEPTNPNSIETGEEKKTDSAVVEEVSKKEEITLEKDQIIFTLRINIQTAENKKTRKIEYKDAESVINFFIRYKSKDRIEDPATIEEYESGKFLNSAQFLIQCYIYELIDTKERAQNFIDAVYEILGNKKNELENKKEVKKIETLDKVFKKCFKEINSVVKEEPIYLNRVKAIKTMGKGQYFPFRDSNQLPIYRRISCYNRKTKQITTEKNFNNCVETALYVLFCCLAYDPAKQTYSTAHMGNTISPELKQFFEDYPVPVDVTTDVMLEKWNKVVADLDCKNIRYTCKEERNGLESGLLNMLLVITKVTGRTEMHKDIALLMERAQAEKADQTLYFDINECFELLLTLLSKNKNVEVSLKDFKIEGEGDRKNDGVGTITLKYTVKAVEYKIDIRFIALHLDLAIFFCHSKYSEEEKKILLEAKDSITSENSFIGYILTHYIDKKMERSTKHSKGLVLAEAIRKITGNYPEEINRIFLVNKIESNDYKMHLMLHYLFCAKKKEAEKGIKLHKESAVLRFTSNILGSINPSNPNLAKSCLSILMYAGVDKSLYENVDISKEQWLKIGDPCKFNSNTVSYFISQNLPYTLLYLLKRFINPEIDPIEDSLFSNSAVAKDTFDCFFENNTMDLGNEVPQTYEKGYGDSGRVMAGLIRIAWFILACNRKRCNIELLQALFDSIDIPITFGRSGLDASGDRYKAAEDKKRILSFVL